MKLNRNLLVCVLCLLFAAAQLTAGAATITITPHYVQSFDPAQTPLGMLADDGAKTPVDGFLQYEFRMSLDDLAADEDFWTAIFDIRLSPGLENASGWMDPGVAQANGYYEAAPSLSMYDSNGAALGGMQAHWQFGNADFGLNPNDLRSIIVETSAAEAANRQYGEVGRPGQGATDGLGLPTLLGTVLVRRTELLASSISIVPIEGSAWGLYTASGVPTSQPPTTFASDSLELAVPEPGTFSLALGALLAGLFRKRRRARTLAE